ncbi:ABC transporter ATP-binding protein [Paraferrimonas haliotis]|uniref:ABC copper transporter ATPase NosF n=1 Tax=Paraferrimonas haliotis TaxID=2013866 RepID=A0AA37TIV2_9GAMM|nr:ABC transporter ATP-binding protein [Paraferrimonas haliotis]GLS82237.1 ABC copper transporter ATPase NosF [Paraferrimonas haliotis]
MNTVTISQLTKRYPSHTALSGINVSLEAGETVALLGHNGAGKSTLIKLILGVIQAERGTIEFRDRQGRLCGRNSPLNIGYLPENLSLYERMTGLKVLSFFADLKGVSTDEVQQTLHDCNLHDVQHQLVGSYSKGMKQRLGLAQAILGNPDLLLLDEPTVGLDSHSTEYMYQTLNSLKRIGCTILVCTHELPLIQNHADRYLILGQGNLLAFGDLEALQQATNLPTRIQLPSNAELPNSLPEEFFVDNDQICCDFSMRAELIKFITTQCQVFDFVVSDPNLSQVLSCYLSKSKRIEGR